MPWELFKPSEVKRKQRGYGEDVILISRFYKAILFPKAFMGKHDIKFGDGKRVILYHNDENTQIGLKITTDQKEFRISRSGNKASYIGAVYCAGFLDRHARNIKPQAYKVECLPDGIIAFTPETI